MKSYKDIVKNIGMDKLILIAIAGVVLIICSFPSAEEDKTTKNAAQTKQQITESTEGITVDEYTKALEERLVNLIENIDGISDAHVMITIKKGDSKEILKDQSINSENTRESDGDGGEREVSSYGKNETTIYITNEAGEEVPYVLSDISPEIEGVAVVAKGGENIVLKEKIINLIKALFGIEINKIMVTV